MEIEKEEQRYGRNKATTINASYIESGEFRRKFDSISNDKELNRLIYVLSKKALYHRSGTVFEDMYWIDPSTKEVIAMEIASEIPERIVYSKTVMNQIRKYNQLLTIHTHPMGLPPSVDDLNSNFLNGYSQGIVVGHNGEVFIYRSNEYIREAYFDMKVEAYIEKGYNKYEARMLALEYCCTRFDIEVKEVHEYDS